MSGGLPPRTAVSTFCSVLSLLTYRLLTFTPGFWLWYSVTRCANALASGPVQPSQIWTVVPPPPPPLLLSVPQAASPRLSAAAAASGAARVTRSRCLTMLPSTFRPAGGGHSSVRSDSVHQVRDGPCTVDRSGSREARPGRDRIA